MRVSPDLSISPGKVLFVDEQIDLLAQTWPGRGDGPRLTQPVAHAARSSRPIGTTRPSYSDGVRKALQGEVGKDLVKLPVYEIEKQLLRSGAAK